MLHADKNQHSGVHPNDKNHEFTQLLQRYDTQTLVVLKLEY